MSWFISYTQLDNEQLTFLQTVDQERNKNFWLQGYAGSGKSVLLIHCLLKEKEVNVNSNVIIVLYTHALIDMIKTGIPSQYQNVQVVTYHQFQRMQGNWDLILVDEVQDLPEDVINDMRTRGRRIIVAGDVNQSIYSNVCPTEQISNLLASSSFPLRVIHRISRRIRQVAQFFCADRTGFNAASLGRLVELPPRLIHANSLEEECTWLNLSAKEYAKSGYSPAILIPRHYQIFDFFQKLLRIENKPALPNTFSIASRESYNGINHHLRIHGLKFQYLGNGAGSLNRAIEDSLVSVMTYHSAKGLDFKAVFVPFLTPELEIWRDPVSRAQTLFFVASTRSREQLFFSYHGNIKHPYLNIIPATDFHELSAGTEITRMNDPFNGQDDNGDPLVVF